MQLSRRESPPAEAPARASTRDLGTTTQEKEFVMSIKRKLFASVAAPVLTLPLLMQPAYAIPPGIGSDPSPAAPGVIRVQQEIIPEEGKQPQEPQAEQPQEQPAQREQQAEQPQEKPRQREQQAEQPSQGEQRNAEQPEGERPQRREQRAQEEGGSEAPQAREQQAEQPQERPRQREQRNVEQPEGERPRQREQRAQEDGGGEKPKRREQQAEQPKPAEEPARQKTEQTPEPQAKPTEQQAEEPKSTPERKQRQQNAEQPAEAQPQQRNSEHPKPAEEPARQNADQSGQREQQPQQGQGSERPQQAQEGQPAPDQATSGGERRQAPAAQQQAEQPATLPVENGAAVLDSAKEQRPERAPRDGERPRRDPNRAGGEQVPGQQPDAQQAQERAAPPPRTDADAQANDQITREQREQWRNQRRELTEERGERMDGRPDFERPRGWDLLGAVAGGDREQGRDRGRDRDRDRNDGRVIISIDNQTIVRHDDSRRFYEDGREPEYERLGDGRYREVVERGDGTRVVTIRNRYGEVVQRSRIVRGGEEYVLYYAPELLEDRGADYTWRDPGDDLPPMRLGVPIDDYIIDTSSEPDRDYYEFLEQPPVERVERPYSLDEVRYSARIRDKVPRIDLDTITFATGSAEIPMNQASSLRKVADAINKVLEKDPSETFLIEGHTDAVGSDDSNLVLSDRRAESVAVVLSDAFNIPPENLTTQGYGERYLKVKTEAANQENRRVTIRRITPLVKPVASKQ
jgi:outer membrane protein OmpA-like peptidoglycan-associated protein